MALVKRLASLKAHSALAEASEGSIIVAADTTVAIDGLELGKPRDDADARRMLHRLSGRTHQVSTGVCLLLAGPSGAPARAHSFVETTNVEFYELDEATIEAYVASGEPADKAGAYGIQGVGRALVRSISGDYFNVVGLPVARTLRELDALLAD